MPIRLLTYNVWFSPRARARRADALAELIARERVDIACLQEVTPPALTCLLRHPSLAAYRCTDPGDGVTLGRYGVCALYRADGELSAPPAVQFLELPTRMGRRALGLSWRRPALDVWTVHLESLDAALLRRAQLERLAERLETARATILCGDFNFDDERDWGRPLRQPGETIENDALARLLPRHHDARPRGPLVKSYDSERNPLAATSRRREQMRYDRVLASPRLRVLEARIVGERAIDADERLWISDHFGVLVTVALA